MKKYNPSASDIIATLRANEDVLRACGITHAALFGSRARGDYRPDSDIDILIETLPDAITDLYTYAGVKARVAALFPIPVDVINLLPAVKNHTEDGDIFF